MKGKLKRVYALLKDGEFVTLTEEVLSYFTRGFSSYSSVVSEENYSLGWINDQKVELMQNNSNYFSYLESDLNIEPQYDCKGIEIPVVMPENSEILNLETNFGKRRIEIDDSFDYPDVIWQKFEIPENKDEFYIKLGAEGVGRINPIKEFREDKKSETELGLPALIPENEKPPVFLISVDTLRYDQKKNMQNLIEELGDNVFVPSEPRTQGSWTPPSHASMITGSHPGSHGYVGYGRGEGDNRPIDTEKATLSEFLTESGYKCSAIVSHSRILPEFGFGRGFHRFYHDDMNYSDWVSREHDASNTVDKSIEWLREDLESRDGSIFYFMHVFDRHYPYLAPIDYINSEDMDFSLPSDYKEEVHDSSKSYLEKLHSSKQIESTLVDKMKDYYSDSSSFTADQITRFVRELKNQEIFEDSLIIVTGDHGEEFGERNFFFHRSLYDNNIRPFMAIKPPQGKKWSKNKVDTIDFFPTIAKLLDKEVPDTIEGQPLQDKEDSEARITEKISPECYNISVENEGVKAIFTYEGNYPDRPKDSLAEKLIEKEFYDLESVRNNNYDQTSLSEERIDEFQNIAEEFIQNNIDHSNSKKVKKKPDREIKEQLQKLGYN